MMIDDQQQYNERKSNKKINDLIQGLGNKKRGSTAMQNDDYEDEGDENVIEEEEN